MFYIFDTEQEALDYDVFVTSKKNYTGNATKNYANPIKHPTLDKWAILANSRFPIEGKETETLDSSWTPPNPGE